LRRRGLLTGFLARNIRQMAEGDKKMWKEVNFKKENEKLVAAYKGGKIKIDAKKVKISYPLSGYEKEFSLPLERREGSYKKIFKIPLSQEEIVALFQKGGNPLGLIITSEGEGGRDIIIL